MKYYTLLALAFTSYALNGELPSLENQNTEPKPSIYRAAWLVVGAGPAGISAVAALRDARVKPDNIIWVDKAFKVGDLGKHYRNVLANSTGKTFFYYFKSSPHLSRYLNYARHLEAPRKTDCTLKEVVAPLALISNRLREEVASIHGTIEQLSYNHQTKFWVTHLPAITLEASNVILATGAHPKQLEHTASTAQYIPLEAALDVKKLKKKLRSTDNIVVFGSSHSAALVLKNLTDLNCTNIVHIQKQAFRFRQKTRLGELYPFSGLKGPVATWARQHLVNKPHPEIKQLQSDAPEVESTVQNSSVIIDAVGYEPNQLPVSPEDLYPTPKSPHELGPHLYGIGIAFPSIIQDTQGHQELAVGILNFMETIKKHLPKWLKKA